jgi:hypothetical protein
MWLWTIWFMHYRRFRCKLDRPVDRKYMQCFLYCISPIMSRSNFDQPDHARKFCGSKRRLLYSGRLYINSEDRQLTILQFWPSLPGDLDNYLSCGECFELIQTYPNGTDYAVGEVGYTPPIILEVVDSCPCDANAKWCCKFPI